MSVWNSVRGGGVYRRSFRNAAHSNGWLHASRVSTRPPAVQKAANVPSSCVIKTAHDRASLPACCTRIRPPRDLVKLEDRLRLLLQPPLESLLSARSRCDLPIQPFSFQFDGVAFLYPRHAPSWPTKWAWAKRCRRSRPFGCWSTTAICGGAAGLPQAAGDQLAARVRALGAGNDRDDRSKATRAGGSGCGSWPTTSVTIANYETVVRDRAKSAERGNHFDLVVLDESQRIKNRGEHDERSRPLDSAQPQLGAHRHADRKQRRRPASASSSSSSPGQLDAEDEAAGHRPGRAPTTCCGARRTRC